MKKPPRISDAEWSVMKVLWSQSPLSANEIIEFKTIRGAIHPQVVRTLLNRLVKKGAIDFEKKGRAFMFRPIVVESECVKAATESFVSRVFNGSLEPLLAHFVEHERLSNAEIEKLEDILRKKRKK